MNWPLMRNNIMHADKVALMEFLAGEHLPRLTQGPEVATLEEEFSRWLGVRHSVFVNSGASANLITMAALKERVGEGEVLVPTITWVSDIAAVLHSGLEPVFVDIDPRTLGMDLDEMFKRITTHTKAVFITHTLGFNALKPDVRDRLAAMRIALIEDCCESMGATMQGQKLGTIGLASNFSFYYAHHMSTIEGGMVCTNDESLYQVLRMMRSHGLVREMTDGKTMEHIAQQWSDLDPEFIFQYPAWNVRSTELNAVIGRSQLKRVDAQNQMRIFNLFKFLESLDSERYVTDYAVEGSCNYALPLIMNEPNPEFMEKVCGFLSEEGVEFRRGTAGGGNQLRQPYLRQRFGKEYERYAQAEHVHFYGVYIGNYPDLKEESIVELCRGLNSL